MVALLTRGQLAAKHRYGYSTIKTTRTIKGKKVSKHFKKKNLRYPSSSKKTPVLVPAHYRKVPKNAHLSRK